MTTTDSRMFWPMVCFTALVIVLVLAQIAILGIRYRLHDQMTQQAVEEDLNGRHDEAVDTRAVAHRYKPRMRNEMLAATAGILTVIMGWSFPALMNAHPLP